MPSASRVNWARFRVTVVSTVALMILGTLAFLLTGGTLLEPKATIFLYVPDATGLDKGSPVRVDGIDIGKVSRVELSGENDPNRIVRLVMTLERAPLAAVTTDSYAEISTDNLAGDKFVDITSRTSPAHIMPGGEIHLKPPSPFMKTLDLPQFEKQLKDIDTLLADIEEGRSEMGQFVKGTQVYSDLLKNVMRIGNTIHAAVSTTTVIGDALYTSRLYDQVAVPMARLEQSLANMQSGQGPAGQMLRDTAQYESVLKDVRDLHRAITEVGNSGWMQSDQMYQDWNRTLVSYIVRADRINADPMLNSTALYESLNGMARELSKGVKDFREDPRKYLRLGVF